MNTSQDTYALIYARTARDAGLSSSFGLYPQICSGIAYAFQNRWLVKKIYLDTGSGISDDHPGMKELLSDIQKMSNETVHLVTEDPARLSRNIGYYESLLKSFNSAGVAVHFCAFGGELPELGSLTKKLISALQSASKREASLIRRRKNIKKETK
ncbi:recombinase family protein [Leisingera aquimarina]|uniref:recombinase family protein n=1 Tax=Leisingera aquimarina TaxID=476529 RepID=UPI0004803293|nr:recombinase family protein [Leisingera aquimarina]